MLGFKSVDNSQQFLGAMRKGCVVGFAFLDLLVIIFGKNKVVVNDRHHTAHERVPQIR